MPLKDVEAQEVALTALRRALTNGRVHHAYLFAGPDGVGKTLAAKGMAEALLCAGPLPDGDACGKCRHCVRTATGQHPDLHRIERQPKADGALEASIRIDQVRELQRALSFKRFEASRRVVIIAEAEKMNSSTANALLKTLEEPGADTHFIVVSSAPHLLLPTILSRCQRVRFMPLPRSVVARHLQEKAGLDAGNADLVACLAEGSIGRGLLLAKSPLLAERADLLAKLDDPRGLHDVAGRLDLAERLAQKKDELPLVLHLLRTWFRDLLLVQEGLSEEQLVHRDLVERARARAAALTAAAILDRLDAINATERGIFDHAANPRLALETLALRLAGAADTRAGAGESARSVIRAAR
jgi:DNA polymerase-3 subunit delta'